MGTAAETRARTRHQLRRREALQDCAGRRAADGAPAQRQFGGAALSLIHGDLAQHAGAQGRWAPEPGRAAAGTAGRLGGLSVCSTGPGDDDEASSRGSSAGEDDREAEKEEKAGSTSAETQAVSSPTG
mmetsp:Transcript_110198/g.307059  ORF Transcript_110198/g.307059 Transcript_110198/m.307059 type:complete len:128 (+) Transcript_110198:54-437(+)